MPLYYYYAFGLYIASEMEIPQFISRKSCQIDVEIREKQVPQNLAIAQFAKGRFQASPGNLLLKIENVAYYHIENGKTICIDKKTDDLKRIRVYLLGSCMAALLYQRKAFVLHASAISTEKGAVVFSGSKKQGKSTLAASFSILRQYPLIADDLVRISTDKDILVSAAFPSVNLWPDVIEKLNIAKEELISVTTASKNVLKYTYSAKNDAFLSLLPLNKIYLLEAHGEKSYCIHQLNTVDKSHFLIKNSYRKNFLCGLGEGQNHLERVAKIAKKVRISVVRRPQNIWDIEKLLELMEKDFVREG